MLIGCKQQCLAFWNGSLLNDVVASIIRKDSDISLIDLYHLLIFYPELTVNELLFYIFESDRHSLAWYLILPIAFRKNLFILGTNTGADLSTNHVDRDFSFSLRIHSFSCCKLFASRFKFKFSAIYTSLLSSIIPKHNIE